MKHTIVVEAVHDIPARFLRARFYSCALHLLVKIRQGISSGWMNPIPPCINSVISVLPRFES